MLVWGNTFASPGTACADLGGDGFPAGIFTYDHDLQVGSFDYGRKYLERPNALAVDPAALPLGLPSRAVTSNKGLYGAFRDGVPDYWGRLVIAAERRVPPEALPFMLNRMQFLVDFYPKHIEKEDRHFFLPVMNYFSQAEKEVMLAEEYEFDKNLIHLIYTEKVHQIKKTETSGKPALAL